MTTSSAARRRVQRSSALGRPFPALILLLAACSPKSAPGGAPADAAAPTDASAADAAGPADAGLTDAGLGDAGEPSAKILSAAIGLDHICVVLADHTVRCWGDNTDGQLGNGQHNLLPLPSDPATPDVDHVVQIAAAELTTCALRDDGEVKCWGPDVVRSAISDPDLVRIAVSGEMVCGHKKDKSVRCTKGGDVGTYEEIVAGAHHVCGRKGDGSVWCWGSNTHGELGKPAGGKLGDFLGPRKSPLGFKVSKIFSGGTSSSTCVAQRDTRKVFCWGEKSGANLGIGREGSVWEFQESLTPDQEWNRWAREGVGDKLATMELGAQVGCVVHDGDAYCCGVDLDSFAPAHGTERLPVSKRLGAETWWDTSWLVRQDGLPLSFTLGAFYRCGITDAGELMCEGKKPGVEWDNPNSPTLVRVHAVATGFIDVPKPVEDTVSANAGSGEPAVEILSIALGEDHMCALLGDHTMRCWGSNESGQLGDDKFNDRLDPSYRAKPDIDHVVQIAVMGGSTCALRDNGEVKCWGYARDAPHRCSLTQPDSGLTRIILSNGTLCAYWKSGEVRCEPGGPIISERPTQVIAGALRTYMLEASGKVSSWDNTAHAMLNDYYRLRGRGRRDPRRVETVALPGRATKLFSGNDAACTCAKLTRGDIWCWGECHGGTPNHDKANPRWKLDGLEDALDIQLGPYYGCALRPAGVVTCWGSDRYGMLGDGTLHPSYSSVRGEYAYPEMPAAPIRGLPPARAIALGVDRACVLTTSGELWCWGGVLGDPTHFDAHPVRVIP